MKHIKSSTLHKTCNYLLGFIFISHMAIGQSIQQEKMEKLHFLIGNWVGTSTTYENGALNKQTPAFEQITYKLDNSIITLDLHSESLQLHTVIYYDEKEDTYLYNPYYKEGAAKYVAEYREGKLVVHPNAEKRFVFTLTAEGKFLEYGEKLVNGKWVKYFEDIFSRIP
ncbi:MAG: hypothetical protein ACI9XJ_002784 [Marivirga sp.]|jgi:hypothetical protein